MNAPQIDDVDDRILELLQSDPRMSNKQIAQLTSLSETTIGNRLERMSSQNIARVIGQSDYKTRGWFASAFLEVTLRSDAHEEAISRLNALENVITIYEMAGPPHLLIKIAAANLGDLSKISIEVVGGDPNVHRVDMNLSLGYGHVRAGFGNLDAPHDDPVPSDDLQSRMLSMLARNGRVSNRELARALGVAEVTVRNRTKALLDQRLMRYLVIRHPEKSGYNALAFAYFTLKPSDIASSVRLLAENPRIFGSTIQTGPNNLMVSIYALDWTQVHEIYGGLCATLPVIETPTFRPAKRFARHRYELAFVA